MSLTTLSWLVKYHTPYNGTADLTDQVDDLQALSQA